MSTHPLRIISTTIDVPFAMAYEFAHKPENFPKWAAGMSDSLRRTDSGWIASTPAGEARVEFSEPNPHGVLDHHVHLGDSDIYIPLRMIANGDGTSVELVLYRQEDMSDEDFEVDAGRVSKDLATLKRLLES